MQRQPTLRELVLSDVAVWSHLWSSKSQDGRLFRNSFRHWRMVGRLVWSHAGLRATLMYRISHAAHRRGIKLLPELLKGLNVALHGLEIPASVPIGPGLYIPHPVGTVVTARRIGANVTLVSAVTIGMRKDPIFPILGDDVYVGAGARILGDIAIGNSVNIGANAVVLTDVPAHSVAIGVPATARPRKVPQVRPNENDVHNPLFS